MIKSKEEKFHLFRFSLVVFLKFVVNSQKKRDLNSAASVCVCSASEAFET